MGVVSEEEVISKTPSSKPYISTSWPTVDAQASPPFLAKPEQSRKWKRVMAITSAGQNLTLLNV